MLASKLEIRNLVLNGPIRYNDALELQRNIVLQRQRGEVSDTLLLLQHRPTVTFGKTTRPENFLMTPDQYQANGLDLVPTDRGGDVTYHGPGQIVGYPIIYLGDGYRDIRRYVRFLEDVVIAVAKTFGIDSAGRVPYHAGVWVGDAYLAAVGVRVSRWVTHHGFALNVNDEVRAGFATIVPCGVGGKAIATVAQFSNIAVDVQAVAQELVVHFTESYNSY